jgi:hypothetical protein
MRLQAIYPNHFCSYEFVFIRDAYGGKIRMLTMIDNGILRYIRSDNGPEYIAKELRSWLSGIGVKTAYIESGSPWKNGFCESFNGTFRDNPLDGKIFYSLREAQIIVGEWFKHYSHIRLQSTLGYRLPASQTKVPQMIQDQPILL